jgi:hypothetical protein
VSAAYDAANHALYEHGSSNGTDLFRVSLDDLSLWRPVDSSLGLRTTGPGRDLVPSVVDTRRHQLIALGRGATTVELWSYVAGRHPSWIRMPVVGNAPPTRQREVAVYDSLRDRVLLHGGSFTTPGRTR